MKKKIRFIINPISGVGKKDTLPHLIEKFLDHSLFQYDIVYTEQRGHAEDLARVATKERVDIVCVVGGDGSINEVGRALLHCQTTMAILPTGSGNGVARHLNIPLKLSKAIKNLNCAKSKTIDVLAVNEDIAIGFGGIGYDAHIAVEFDYFHRRGLLSYAYLVVRELFRFKGISVTINGKKYTDLFFCSFANSSQFGNGFYISPQSVIDDGFFEIVLLKKPTCIISALHIFFSFVSKKMHQSKYATILSSKETNIKIADHYRLHIDGDPKKTTGNYLKIKVLNNALRVWI